MLTFASHWMLGLPQKDELERLESSPHFLSFAAFKNEKILYYSRHGVTWEH